MKLPRWLTSLATLLAPALAAAASAPAWLTLTADATSSRGTATTLVATGPDGRLGYRPTADGATIPDFSRCGYGGGGVALPVLPVKVTLAPQPGGGDDRERIQAAIDQVAALPADAHGFRGAVLLRRGHYRVHGTLKITTSGIVLRGEGPEEGGTVLTATLAKKHDVIEVGGTGDLRRDDRTRRKIVEARVPMGARSFRVADAAGFKVGDRINVHRPSPAEWIATLGMDRLSESTKPGVKNWSPGGFDLHWDREIVALEGDRITLDAPISQAIEDRFGGGSVVKIAAPGWIEQCGVEQLRIVSVFDRTKVKPDPKFTPAQAVRAFTDEDHAWNGVVLDRIRHAWVSRVTVVHAGYSAVHTQYNARFTTVVDCALVDPVSQHTGGRKYSFGANGQFGLVLRCFARNGRHDFVLGARVAGPNVFLDCLADQASSASEPHHRFGTGCLWDNVRLQVGGELQAINRGDSGTGHGWAGANHVFWNCAAPIILVMQPPTAQNFALGWTGATDATTLNAYARERSEVDRLVARSGRPWRITSVPILGDGHIESPTAPVAPRSLYLKQLEDRLGPAAVRVLTATTPGPSL